MKRILLGILIGLGMAAYPAYALRIQQPQPITEWTTNTFTILNTILSSLWDISNGRYEMDIVTTNPEGTRRGNAGEFVLYNTDRDQICINTDSATTWYCVSFAMGEVSYFSTTGTSISIAVQSDGSTNMVKAGPATSFSNDLEFDNGGSNNGRLRYTGTRTKMFHVACTISIAPDGANDTFVLGVAKNGTVQAASKVLQKITTANDTQSTALHLMVELSTNDYLELYVGNTTDADDLTIKTLNLFAMGM